MIRIDREDISAALASIDAAWAEVAPNRPIERRFLDEQFEEHFRTFARMTDLLSALAGIATLIALAGLVGMTAHVLHTRTREIGIRKVLGAGKARIASMLLADLSRPIVFAALAASPIAYAAAHAYIQAFAYRMHLGAAPFIAGLALVFSLVLLVTAGYVARAARAAPARTLRCE